MNDMELAFKADFLAKKYPNISSDFQETRDFVDKYDPDLSDGFYMGVMYAQLVRLNQLVCEFKEHDRGEDVNHE